MNKLIYKLGLVMAGLLLVCLFPMPYGYYTLVRFVAMVYFVCLAYCLYKDNNTILCIVSCSMALLFQPFFKIALGRMMWNVVDVILAIALILLWFSTKDNKK